ncbi:MAG: YhbY family RNA-binding protein [Candidatus Fimenecus sp.]
MTSKERAELRGQANTMQPLFQVGKGGISDALIKQTDDALTARELIKIKVLLETAPEKPKEIAQKLAEATNSECVGVIGGSMIFYRYNPELHKDEKKKAKNKGRK